MYSNGLFNSKFILFIFFFIAVINEGCFDEGCRGDKCDDSRVECQNGGTFDEENCECDCPEGFTGLDCRFEDECVTQNVTCPPGSTCISGDCICDVDGSTVGPDGDCNVEPCGYLLCQNGGTCNDGVCDCLEGSYGDECENLWRDKFVGRHAGTYTCERVFNQDINSAESFEISANWTISPVLGIDKLKFFKLKECTDLGENVFEFELTDENNFKITEASKEEHEDEGLQEMTGFYNGSFITINREEYVLDLDLDYVPIEKTTSCSGNFEPSTEMLCNPTVQELLDGGVSPLQIHNQLIDLGLSSEAALDSLYGKMYEGGLIMYVDVNNEVEGIEGLVAATEDQINGGAEWGCFGTDIIGLANTTMTTEEGARIGDGAANTDAILAECTDDGTAAKLCNDLGEDWFLPSRGELNLMYTNLHAKGHGEFAAVASYWSSTESSGNEVWFHGFFDGSQGVVNKGAYYHVRAARAF